MICPISKPSVEQVKKGAVVVAIGAALGAVAHLGYKYYMKHYSVKKSSDDTPAVQQQ